MHFSALYGKKNVRVNVFWTSLRQFIIRSHVATSNAVWVRQGLSYVLEPDSRLDRVETSHSGTNHRTCLQCLALINRRIVYPTQRLQRVVLFDKDPVMIQSSVENSPWDDPVPQRRCWIPLQITVMAQSCEPVFCLTSRCCEEGEPWI